MSASKKIIQYLVDTILWLFGKGAYVLYFFFGWRFVSLSGKLFAGMLYRMRNTRRQMTEEELTLLLGRRLDEETKREIVKKSFENYYMRKVETIFFGTLNQQRMHEIMEVTGLENLNFALSKGKGVILLLSHFGSFLLPLPFLGYQGYTVNQVTGKQRHTSLVAERIWMWRKKEADKLPVRYLQVGKFLRPVFQALQNNEIIAIAFDGRDGAKWVEVEFFDRTALFSSGPFELARKTGATIIPTFVIREKDLRHTLVLEKPFELSDDPDITNALRIDTAEFGKIFARYVAQYPCHFAMILSTLREQRMNGTLPSFFGEKRNYSA